MIKEGFVRAIKLRRGSNQSSDIKITKFEVRLSEASHCRGKAYLINL